jgi:hypothetical protein
MDHAANEFSSMFLVGIALGMLALGAAGGFLFAKNRRTGPVPEREPNKPPLKPDEDVDVPTAPISPMVSMARSPHDRHRDLEVGNAIVKKIELLEFVLKSGDKQTRESLIQQVRLVKDDFQGLLGNCSFRPFDYAPGTIIDFAMRSRIQIVEGRAGDGRTVIVKTLRCGFVYEPGGDEEPVVIRKAEVEIG